MKKNILLKLLATSVFGLMLTASLTSCKKDPLQLSPLDFYGSGNYWKTPAHASAYVVGLHKDFRDIYWTHTMTFGEIRGGTFRSDVATSSDAMTLADGILRYQNLSEESSFVSNFANYFGRITNINLFLSKVDDIKGLNEDERNYYKAQAHGLRAFYYFELYRVYGGVPLRLGIEVIDGERDPNKLYLKRSAPKEIIAQVEKDLEESFALFGDRNGFSYYGQPTKAFWNKAATEALMAEVALWRAKVSTYGVPADPTKIDVAKTHLLNLVNNYGLKLADNFGEIFGTLSTPEKKANSEIILSWRFQEGEATNRNGAFLYDFNGGQTKNQLRMDGTPWNNPWSLTGWASQSYEYDRDLFDSYDNEDRRKLETFYPAYRKENPSELFSTFLNKKSGRLNAQGIRVFDSDYPIYRLAWVYLSLAEVANYEGNNADVEKYVNMIRKRAYGDNWNPTKFGYKPGDFTANELAILAEKDKEFVQEGQRWWDVNRMTLTKDGEHLVFVPEGNKYQNNNRPILNKATEAYKVLWPVDKALLDNDKTIKQTPGYKTGENTAYEGDWN